MSNIVRFLICIRLGKELRPKNIWKSIIKGLHYQDISDWRTGIVVYRNNCALNETIVGVLYRWKDYKCGARWHQYKDISQPLVISPETGLDSPSQPLFLLSPLLFFFNIYFLYSPSHTFCLTKTELVSFISLLLFFLFFFTHLALHPLSPSLIA